LRQGLWSPAAASILHLARRLNLFHERDICRDPPLSYFSPITAENGGRDAAIPYQSGVHSCIAATLAKRLKLNRVFNGGDRL
jgi:hypothetical protein